MPKLKQLNVEVEPEIYDLLSAVVEKFGMTRRATVEVAVESVANLMLAHARVADEAEEDIGKLFMRAAKAMPVWLDRQKVEAARFSDGRPGLVIDDDWILGEDRNGQLMVVRRNGTAIGHIKDGRIEVLRDHELEVAEIAALQ